MTDVQWATLQPILQDLTDRIVRIEQFLASSGLQAPGQSTTTFGDTFDAVPNSFGPPPGGTPGQMAAAAHGINVGVPGPMSNQVPDYIIAIARSNLIQAVKEYRDITGLGLREAKAAVERAAGR
jgi:hypothetical protein